MRATTARKLLAWILGGTAVLLLLVGAVSFGMAFFSYVAMRDAAQEGALYGSINPYVDADSSGDYTSGELVNEAGIRERIRASSTSPVNFSDPARVPDAYIRAVTFILSTAFTSAPLLSSSSATSACPLTDARIRTVPPSLFVALTSAP